MHRPVVTQHQTLAVLDARCAPARSPWPSSVLTLAANTIATMPGIVPMMQHRHSDSTVAMIAQAR